MEKLSVKECLRFGWQTFRTRTWFFVGATAVLSVAEIVYLCLNSFSESDNSLIAFVFGLASLAISFLLGMSQIAFSLRAHDTPAAVALRDLWAPRPFWKFVGTTLLMWVLILIGLILLIIPGIIVSLGLVFATYIVMDKQTGPVEALKSSWAMTKGNRWNLFLLLLASAFINVLGVLVLVVGLFVTVPVTLLALAHAYRILNGKQGASVTAPVEVTPVVPAETVAI